MKNEKLRVDIVERTYKFAIMIVKFSNKLPKTPAGFALGSQLVRSGTSIGANVEEAQAAISKKEFIQKMQISLKEARETKYWLGVITQAELLTAPEELLKESSELIAIINTIVRKAKEN